jgi:transcription-repair coupling factor (superfamily II helicase)
LGKTEIAVRAAFKTVVGGKQVAILVPTTILALQHYHTFKERLEEFGVKVDYVNRFRTAKEKREIYEQLKEGNIDLVIGTHSLLNKKVGFKDLGLLVIDEEQKFGVAAKERLRNIKVNVDTLTLTATPIPRTLQFSLMAARDLSIIRTPPPNRQPIHTEVRTFSDELVKEAIYFEVNRGGQVFFVHNRVKNLVDIAAMVTRLCPDVDIAVAHGQMDPKKLEKTLLDFIEKNTMSSSPPTSSKRAWISPTPIR